MEAIKSNKGLIAVALLLALLVGVSAYNSQDSDGSSASTATAAEESQESEEKSNGESTDNKEGDKVKEESRTDEAPKETEADTEAEAESTDQSSYNYTAQPGDSYSVLARKAVQTYGLVNDVRLSLAEILAAEAKLTLDANQPYLNEGQAVAINQADVKAAMDHAQGLSDEEEAVWATYVPYVDFDTRKHGE